MRSYNLAINSIVKAIVLTIIIINTTLRQIAGQAISDPDFIESDESVERERLNEW
jgi:hypothetical protein